MFTLQKMMWYTMVPPASLVILIALGLLVQRRYFKAGRGLILIGLILLYLLSLAPVADLILKPLEGAYPVLQNRKIVADAVVVPGAGAVNLAWKGAAPIPSAETYARLVKGVELSQKLGLPLVLCGGNGEPFSLELRDAEAMAEAAQRLGVPARRIIIENKSRNTLENSYAVRKLVSGNRIVLATSAYYMRRAVMMFERRGFTVIPAPVYFLTQNRKSNPAALIPGASNLFRSSTGIAEWVGMAWWRLRGEI
jgi:uncharacterized SAM-binding protein YcdF (DUF218 family)